MKVTMNVINRCLRLDNDDGLIVGSASKHHLTGKWKWHAMGRCGRAFRFDTAEQALRESAKRLGVTISEVID